MTSVIDRPATYRELFAVGEFRTLFIAQMLSAAGDMLAKVAISILVFERTQSALLAAAAFAISYLPSVLGGPFLATIADRLPWRHTMVGSDLLRAALVVFVALPGTPLWGMLSLLFVVALLTSPFDAARISMLPHILVGEDYVLGSAALNVSHQMSQIVGFAAGGLIVSFISPHGALFIDAATFAVSAALLHRYLRLRPSPLRPEQRSTLRRDTAEGFRLIYRHDITRMLVLFAWCVSAFGFAHEGLAVPLAHELGGDAITVGLILAVNPLGVVLGGTVFTRMIGRQRRLRLLPPLAFVACGALVLVALPVPLWTVLVLFFISGLGMSFILPLNALFNRVVPSAYRGRAAGVVLSGLMAGQGLAIVAAGWSADHMSARAVVGIAGVLGIIATALLTHHWPNNRRLTRPIEEPQREATPQIA